MKRRICVVTGTRAEYGLLRWLLHELRADESVDCSLVVTGSHLSEEHGDTYKFILDDGFVADELIPILDGSDGENVAVGFASSRALMGFTGYFNRSHPDIVVILGDRYEMLAVAFAALPLRIPVAHIHGGEVTSGAMDDSIRHAITKLSHLHFASCDEYRGRILQLGEDPAYVWNTGSVALDNFDRLALLDRAEVLGKFAAGVEATHLALLTVHPTTLLPEDDQTIVQACVDELMAIPGMTVIATEANADQGGASINRALRAMTERYRGRLWLHKSLGQLGYLSAMVSADVVVGNSSSGIVEAPSAGTPTVNVGHRQDGRLRAPSVIDSDPTPESLRRALRSALSPAVRSVAERRSSPFGSPGASQKIARTLGSVGLDGLTLKKFVDIASGDRS